MNYIQFLLKKTALKAKLLEAMKAIPIYNKKKFIEISESFPAMKEFVKRMVERLDIAENRDNIYVVQYCKDTYVHFYLNT